MRVNTLLRHTADHRGTRGPNAVSDNSFGAAGPCGSCASIFGLPWPRGQSLENARIVGPQRRLVPSGHRLSAAPPCIFCARAPALRSMCPRGAGGASDSIYTPGLVFFSKDPSPILYLLCALYSSIVYTGRHNESECAMRSAMKVAAPKNMLPSIMKNHVGVRNA